jgi:hypothetical protein
MGLPLQTISELTSFDEDKIMSVLREQLWKSFQQPFQAVLNYNLNLWREDSKKMKKMRKNWSDPFS